MAEALRLPHLWYEAFWDWVEDVGMSAFHDILTIEQHVLGAGLTAQQMYGVA